MNELANKLEQAVKKPDDYELMVACANDEDADGMQYLGRRVGVEINEDAAWVLIERYATKGSAY
jgi:hypothetical protein